ncbi:hypothetical protein TNCV_3968591 [Trichonephila clavipes]|nr:hypothetical protein TNCV_3968591 [Trichonephila clavipes]
MEGDQDCMEGHVKSLRCSAAKHTVRNEQYVNGHCHGAIGSNFEAMDVSFQRAVPLFAGHSCCTSRLR